MRSLCIIALVSTLVTLSASQSSITSPPEKVVEQLWAMATRGGLLTRDGRKSASKLFVRSIDFAEPNLIRVVSNSYGVAPAMINGDTAKLVVWCKEIGKIDSKLRFTPAPNSPSYKTARGYTVVLPTSKLRTYASDGKTLVGETKGAPEWKIDGPPDDQFTTVNTAIRYVLEKRDSATDSTMKDNADNTLTILKRYH
jgi:hypothetical protein